MAYGPRKPEVQAAASLTKGIARATREPFSNCTALGRDGSPPMVPAARFVPSVLLAVGMVIAAVPDAVAQAPKGKGQERPAQVRVDSVVREPLSQTAPVIGRLVPRRGGAVAAQTKGAVSGLRVRVGDSVEKGGLIAVLDIERLTSERDARRAMRAAAEAHLRSAEARLEQAGRELARIEGLRRSAAFNKALLQDKEQERRRLGSDADAARAQLAQARANEALAELDLARGTVRAPYAGVVTARHTEVGAYVKEGDRVVTLVDGRDLEVEADVPAERTAGLAPGTEVELALPDGTRHTAVVRAVVPDENARTRTRPVRFTPRFGEVETPLAANAAVTVALPVGRVVSAITVHKDAIVRRGGQVFVYVVENGRATLRPVRLGRASGTRFEILGGLAEGDLAVIRGNERLTPNQAVAFPGKAPAGRRTSG